MMAIALKKGVSVILFMSNLKRLFNKPVFKTAFAYVIATLFSLLVSTVYNMFSHDVYSSFMSLLCLWPLSGGILATFGVYFAKDTKIRIPFNIFNSGVATLTCASAFKGVLEIAHATSTYEILFWVAGLVFTTLGILLYMIFLVLKGQEKESKNTSN